MIDVKHIIESSNNSISIKDCDVNSVISITVPLNQLSSEEIENTAVFKVDEQGKIIFSDITNENKGEKGITSNTEQDLLDRFKNLPEDLSEQEINEIIEFSNEKVIGAFSYAKMVPYSVKLTDSGDIKIILVIYNGGKLQLNLAKLPLKLIDANKSIILAELVDINAVVDYGKLGIFPIIVSGEKLKEKTINLEEWKITFSM